ncbi:MAG: septum formation initiator family protein [Deltaproteobacteria bacterium]|nr:septum formation initiator family protein [Deltaproteobacteria bacterium]
MYVPPAWRRWGARVGLALAIAVAIAYLPWRTTSDERVDKLRGQLDATNAEIARLAHENAQLEREVAALRTDARAIIDHARDELGLVYPGEVVLRVQP